MSDFGMACLAAGAVFSTAFICVATDKRGEAQVNVEIVKACQMPPCSLRKEGEGGWAHYVCICPMLEVSE